MTIAHYHLPGLFEFYELYCRFCRSTETIRNISMIGATSARFTAHRRIACGAVGALGRGSQARGMCWR